MVNIENSIQINIDILKHNIEHFRTIEKLPFNKDELYKSDNGELLFLCHTISEGSNGAYYCQHVILKNTIEQEIILNLKNFWTPLWEKNFKYEPTKNLLLTSVTCFNKESNSNPLPQILISITNKLFTMAKRKQELDLANINSENYIWSEFEENLNICETYERKYAI